MKERIVLRAPDRAEPVRLDRFLVEACPETRRALVLRAIERGDVRVNEQRASKGLKLVSGDRIEVVRLETAEDLVVRPDPARPLRVVYEDACLLALDKPPHQPVHPLQPGETGTLANALVARYPELARIGSDPLFPAMAHRIDTDTSGLVLAARTDAAYWALRKQFRERSVRKTYLALVEGRVERGGRVDAPLEHTPGRRGVMRPAANAKAKALSAVTAYAPIERFAKRTLLRVVIRSGVTHQIRCHLASVGCPIVGDKVYGAPARETGGRHFLHAQAMELTHPADGRRLCVEAPLASDLEAVLDALRAGDTQNGASSSVS